MPSRRWAEPATCAILPSSASIAACAAPRSMRAPTIFSVSSSAAAWAPPDVAGAACWRAALDRAHLEESLERMVDNISLSVAEGIATVTLARPPVNAFNAEMLRAFNDILDQLAPRADWRV